MRKAIQRELKYQGPKREGGGAKIVEEEELKKRKSRKSRG